MKPGIWTALVGSVLAAAILPAQQHNGITLIEADLIADSETLVPGRGLTVGVHLKIAEGWHTYWANPGDSGIPASVEWDLPEGVRIGELQWPLPEKVREPGELDVYAYKDEVLLMARVYAVPGFEGEEITIRASADWLVCRESCIPGDAELSLTVPVGDEVRPVHSGLFAEFRDRLPRRFAFGGDGIETRWERDGDTLYLLLKNVPPGAGVDFFPRPGEGILAGHAEEVDAPEGGFGDFAPERVLAIPLEVAPADLRELDGVLVVEEGLEPARRGWVL